jgi:hypothetical protein
MEVKIPISDNLYRRAKRLADMRHQEVTDVILDVLEDALPAGDMIEELDPETEQAMQREMAAYIALHPELKEKYLGKSVAIYKGELIDMDDNFGELYKRIRSKYPDVFVWLTIVKKEAIGTIHMRSPRFVRD